MTKHTTGPWRVVAVDWSSDGNARFEIKGITRTGVADARLISAAPELLEALADCVDVMLDMGIFVDPEHPHRIALNTAEHLIARINGASQ